MANTGTVIVLIAGGSVFANEWYQTHQINWRVPVATVIGAAIIDGISHLDNRVSTGLAVMIMIGAMTTQFNGQSVASTLATLFNTHKPGTTVSQKPHVRNVSG